MLIIPSYFNANKPDSFSDYIYNNLTMKIGQIIQANYPDPDKDKNSFITYDVMVNEQKEAAQYNVIYYDCMPMQSFGSAADYLEYTLRANVSEDQPDDVLTTGTTLQEGDDTQAKKMLGATVVIACIGGDGTSPVIVGYLPSFLLEQNKAYKPQSKDDGKFLRFNFNGIKININNDGELFVQRQGPTTNDGQLDEKADAGKKENVGSLIQIDKEGSIIVSAGTNEDTSDDKIKPQLKMTKKGQVTIITPKSTLTMDKDGKVSLVSSDINLGDTSLGATDNVAKSFKSLNEMNKIIKYLTAINGIFTGPPIPEPGMGAPSQLQLTLQIASQAVGGVPSLEEPKCDTTKVK